ncbi:MAG: DEAD/DEAH box helicase [Limnochordia bacterium]|jgi:SNF2 family DNA or RNA helicase
MQILHDPGSLEVLRSFVTGSYDSKQWYELRNEAESLSLSRGFDRLVSLEALDIELYEHQKEAVFRVLRDMRGRALLADEVGLGKTIEAGVTLREYLMRGLVHSVLILVPASLLSQWCLELAEKIKVRIPVGRGPASFETSQVIASLDTAKRPENAAIIHARRWDMVIVDEAHRLKNKKTANWKFVNAIEKKYLLLLTATPVQNDLSELYNLITLLQPGQLKTYSQFKQEFMLDKHSPKNLTRLRELLSEVMVRRGRREVFMRFPRREVRSMAVPLSSEERVFYTAMVDHLRCAYRAQPANKRNLLPLLLLLRETCSHPAAARATLQAMHRVREQRLLPEAALVELLELSHIASPAKLRLTMEFLAGLRQEKAIVFTEFKATQMALAMACQQAGVGATLYHGGLDSKAKQAAIDEFRHSSQVLISTEAGGEGHNFQFCQTLINYDLPWNPMRLEQRIGRVHRLGQQRPVLVVNVVTEGTVEAYMLYLLERKIGMFTKVIGELDIILANLKAPYERVMAEIALESRDEPEMRERIEAFGRELAEACHTYEHVRRLNAQIFDTDSQTMELEA